MARNGISTLATKEQRQIAKLDLAAIKRGQAYDRDSLPTKYVGNTVVNNANMGGLQHHRPWTTGPTLTPYPQRANYAFDFITPPVSGTVWNDDVNQVSASIIGTATRTTNFGGGIIFNGTDTYLDISDTTTGVSNLTISMAADFESTNGNWNVIYSGGNYGGNDVFAYISGGNTDGMSVGTGDTINPPGAIVNTGLAWWDFVYNDTNVTVYKNGAQLFSGTIGTANTGFTQDLLIGLRYGSNGDFLNGTIYRIKGVLSALNQSAIVTQYNSIATTYGLTPISSSFTKLYGTTAPDGFTSANLIWNSAFPQDPTGWTISGQEVPPGVTVLTYSFNGNQAFTTLSQEIHYLAVTYTFTAP